MKGLLIGLTFLSSSLVFAETIEITIVENSVEIYLKSQAIEVPENIDQIVAGKTVNLSYMTKQVNDNWKCYSMATKNHDDSGMGLFGLYASNILNKNFCKVNLEL